MNRWLKRCLGIIACACVFFGVLALLGLWWISANREKMLGGNEILAERVATVAADGPQACVDAALAWRNGGSELMNEVEAQAFAAACLREAGSTDSICEGVPAPGDLAETAEWTSEYCAGKDRDDDELCVEVAQVIAETCRTR